VTFRDYVSNISTIKDSLIYKRDKQYWLKKINYFPLYPQIPLLSKPENIILQRIKRIDKTISEATWIKVKKKAKEFELTPSSVLMGIYALTLKEASGDGLFSINITFDKRMMVPDNLEGVVGDFTSNLLLEINLMTSEEFPSFAYKLQNQLSRDINHSSFTGLDFQRELSKERGDKFKYGIPIVYTSTLGMENDTSSLFGNIKYSITQTPQVWIDFQIQELSKEIYLNIDYVEGLIQDKHIEELMECFTNYIQIFTKESNFVVGNYDEYQEGLI